MINKYSSVPLYSQLKNLITEKIEKGVYAEDSKIPSEQELCDSFDISRPTVRQAISELTNNGYLYKAKGKGTFVSKSKSSIDVKNYTGFTDSILDSQDPSSRNIIDIKITTSAEMQKLEDIFKLPSSAASKTEFAQIKYVSTHNKEVFSLNVSYLPISLFPNIIEDINAKKPSYDILKGKYPLLPAKTKSTLEVIYTEQADAQYIQVQSGYPLIKIDNILSSKSGQVVEYIVSKYRADKYRLLFENTK